MLDWLTRDGTWDLHVLLVESDPMELKRTGTRLLAEGCVVSTCRMPGRLFDVAQRVRPDIVLLDPVTPGVDLVVVLGHVHAQKLPPIALHSKVLKYVLAAVLDLNDFVGLIRKTDDDRAFQEAFLAVTDELEVRKNRRPAAQPVPTLSPAASGTHRIGEMPAAVLPAVLPVRRARRA